MAIEVTGARSAPPDTAESKDAMADPKPDEGSIEKLTEQVNERSLESLLDETGISEDKDAVPSYFVDAAEGVTVFEGFQDPQATEWLDAEIERRRKHVAESNGDWEPKKKSKLGLRKRK